MQSFSMDSEGSISMARALRYGAGKARAARPQQIAAGRRVALDQHHHRRRHAGVAGLAAVRALARAAAFVDHGGRGAGAAVALGAVEFDNLHRAPATASISSDMRLNSPRIALETEVLRRFAFGARPSRRFRPGIRQSVYPTPAMAIDRDRRLPGSSARFSGRRSAGYAGTQNHRPPGVRRGADHRGSKEEGNIMDACGLYSSASLTAVPTNTKPASALPE